MKKRILFGLVCLSSMSFGQVAEQSEIDGSKTPTDYAILDLEPLKSTSDRFQYAMNASLDEGELVKVMSVITKCEADNANGKEKVKGDGKIGGMMYSYQLVPFVDGMGNKIIWVNAFCAGAKTATWETNVISNAAGGNCYFNVCVNLTSIDYYDLVVNKN